MKISVPEICNDRAGYAWLAWLSRQTASLSLLETVLLDFGSCRFFEANMAAPLGAILARAQRADLAHVVADSLLPEVKLILSKNGFLALLGLETAPDRNRTTIPFRNYKAAEGRMFAEHVAEHLSGKGIPDMTLALQRAFRTSLLEVFQNAADHSDSEVGIFVCGQYFPNKKRVDLTITDGGVGIRERVREKLGARVSSVQAIEWAFKQGNTTRAGQNPGGMGLKLLADFIVHNRGKIQVLSRQGFCEFAEGHYSYTKLEGDFRGTSVTLEVNTADTQSYALAGEQPEQKHRW